MRDLDPSNSFVIVFCFDCRDLFNPNDSPIRPINHGFNPWDRPIAQKIEQPVKVERRPIRQDKSE